MKKNVIVVGGGASGLIAARELSKKYNVTIIEARQVLGGRIRSFYLPGLPQALEEGPEFIHGKLPITLSLFKEAGIEILPLSGSMFRKENGVLKEQQEMIEGWEELIKKMKEEKENLTINRFLEKYYPGPQYAGIRKQMIAYAGGFDLADPSRAAIKELYKEWSHEGESFRVSSGYVSLINFLGAQCLKNGCEIIKGEKISSINWDEGKVTVNNSDGKKYVADKVVVSIPVNHLSGNTSEFCIRFIPELKNYTEAFKNIGFGTVLKVLIHFKKPFWDSGAGFFISDEQIPTWWTLLPMRAPVLTGWAGGPVAESLSKYTDQELFEIAMVSLSNIFSLPSANLRNNVSSYSVFNWKKIPEASGAYSYSTPDSATARKVLNTPISDTVFFTGEGLYDGNFPGTVEAALTSGLETASRL